MNKKDQNNSKPYDENGDQLNAAHPLILVTSEEEDIFD